MVETCCVPLCHQRGYRDENGKKVTYHKFPAIKKVLKQWIIAIKRDPGTYFSIERTTKVCSRHFTENDFVPNVASGRRYLRENAVPSIFPFLKKVVHRPPPKRQPLQTLHMPQDSTDVACSDSMLPDQDRLELSGTAAESSVVPASTDDSQARSCCACRTAVTKLKQELAEKNLQLAELHNQVGVLRNASDTLRKANEDLQQVFNQRNESVRKAERDLERSKEQVVCLLRRNQELINAHAVSTRELESKLSEASKQMRKFCVELFVDDDEKMQFYTGQRSYAHFKQLLEYVGAESDSTSSDHPNTEGRGRRHKLSTENQFFLTPVKLRTGFFHMHLAHIFDISTSTVSRIFSAWINLLYIRLTEHTWWPPRDVVDSTMPEAFKKKYSSTRAIIDATEVRCEVPSSLVLQSGTYWNYKSTNTFKGLIAISPNGLVSFVSDLYMGSASDRELVIKSGFLEREFTDGDTVMADKGFKIKDLLEKKGVGLNLPPFLNKEQFTEAEVRETADIASLRIHVERRIQRIKMFHIFDKVIPLSLGPIVNQIWVVCTLLSNFQTPIVKELE
ncbi:hypothetical protein HPB48_018165 [Haemaphysalis longicornis]|uniref:THAP-type domain-containing protein n=1 Tax=Haemaphysalis longicornis TaxID=44386 RepID=A0A9J6FV12_HAELO|nr:hypothetical protein HPB48_018165 [Haemaphysalis longicornis]